MKTRVSISLFVLIYAAACGLIPTPSPTFTPTPANTATLTPSPILTKTSAPTATTTPPLPTRTAPSIGNASLSQLNLLTALELEVNATLQSFTFSEDATLIGATDFSGHSFVWDSLNFQLIIDSGNQGASTVKMFSPFGNMIWTAREKSVDAVVRDIFAKETLFSLRGYLTSDDIAYSSTLNAIALQSLSDSWGVAIWDLTTLVERNVSYEDWLGDLDEASLSYTRPFGIFFSPDGSLITTYLTDAKTSVVWDVKSGEWVIGFVNGERPLAFSPDSTILAVRMDTTKVALFETTNWQQIGIIGDRNARIADAEFSLDNQLVFVLTDDGNIDIWDRASIKKLRTLPAFSTDPVLPPEGFVYKLESHMLRLSSDGTMLASYSYPDFKINIWGIP